MFTENESLLAIIRNFDGLEPNLNQPLYGEWLVEFGYCYRECVRLVQQSRQICMRHDFTAILG